jgi:hypothetical protein
LNWDGYRVAYVSRLADVFPIVELPPESDTTVETLLEYCLAGLNVKAVTMDKQILLICTAKMGKGFNIYDDLRGMVMNEQGQPLENATVSVEGSDRVVIADTKGHFRMPVTRFVNTVIISHSGYYSRRLVLSSRMQNMVMLPKAPVQLDAVFVEAYSRSSPDRLATTGSYYREGKSDVNRHVTGVLEALKGQVPGLLISDVNGVPGSAKFVQLGGTHSVLQGSQPLFLLDGIPLAQEGWLLPIGSGSAQGKMGANALSFIEPENIAGVTVRKDASAAGLYGTQASNGVILFTLKKGKSGPLQVTADVSGGLARTVPTSAMLSTRQYLQLRREAVRNDRLPLTARQLPEAFAWDTTQQTDFKRLAMGGNVFVRNAGIQASGGTERHYFLLSGKIHQETTVFPGQTPASRYSAFVSQHNGRDDDQWQLNFSGLYSFEDNRLPQADYTPLSRLVPNAPFAGIPATPGDGDPVADKYKGEQHTLFGHQQAIFRFDPHFSVDENLGYHLVLSKEEQQLPASTPDRVLDPMSIRDAVTQHYYAGILGGITGRWSGAVGPGQLQAAMGSSWQRRSADFHFYQSGAIANERTAITVWNTSLFGTMDYAIARRYMLSGTLRHEAGSGWGAIRSVGNFWSLGGAWVFYEEPLMGEKNILTFGKVRANIGTTGNEPDAAGLLPARSLSGQSLWELNVHEEVGADLGFFHDKLLVAATGIRSWTRNQLLNVSSNQSPGEAMRLRSAAGVNVENRALEFEVQLNKIILGPLECTSSFALTIPQNRLVRWPGLENSIYAGRYVMGRSLSVSRGYHFTGVDPLTGLYTFRTARPGGTPAPGDLVPNAGFDPKYYAGWNQQIRMGHLELSLLFDYRRERGINPLVLLAQQNAPGMLTPGKLSNGPVEWLDHWRKPGDIATQQRPTSGGDALALLRLNSWLASDASSIDASYLRLRNVHLEWSGKPLSSKWGVKGYHIYIQGENLWTVTRYPVTDAETKDPNVLPPLKMVRTGIKLEF